MNGRRASRGMAVVRPIASAVLRTALTPKADILERDLHVRLVQKSRHSLILSTGRS